MSEKEKVVRCFWDQERECPHPRVFNELSKSYCPGDDEFRTCQLCLMAEIAKELYWHRETKGRLGR